MAHSYLLHERRQVLSRELTMAKSIARATIVKRKREERAWTQAQLAEVANLSLRTIQRLERNGSAASETLMAVASAFKIDVKELSPTMEARVTASEQRHVYLLPRIVTGRDLAAVVLGTDQFQFEHDEDQDPRSVQAMKGILDLLKQDAVRMYDAEELEERGIEAEMTKEIGGLESYGYYLFGIKRTIPRIVEEQITLTSMTTFYLSHSRSPRIVRDQAHMAVPAVLTEISR